MDTQQIPHILPNAVIPVSIGSLHIKHLQDLFIHIATPEFREKCSNKQPLEPYEEGIVSLYVLLKSVTDTAVSSGQVEFKSVETLIQTHL